MASAVRPNLPLMPALACMLASGLLLYFATRMEPVPWLGWIAPWPVLAATHRSGGWRGFMLCIASWWLGAIDLASYLHGTLSLPPPIVLLAVTIPAVQFALVAALSRTLAARGKPLAAVLALPSAWVAIDYLQSLGSPHGTFGNLAYTQIDLLPVAQLAALTGVWGIDFLLMLVPAALAVLTAHVLPQPVRLRIALGTAVACACMLAYGSLRLAAPGGATLRVALLSADEPAFPHPWQDAASQRMLSGVDAAIADAAGQHPHLIVLPETIVALDPGTSPAFFSHVQDWAHRSGATIVVGADVKDRDAERNTALVFDPGSEPVARYAKQHLLPPFELRYQPGHESFIRRAASATWGVAICKDMDFPALSRAYAQAGSGLMAVPAWDFVRDGRLHARMAVMRGIENGFAVARSARGGRMTVSDAYGRVLAERTSAAHVATLVADVPVAPLRTWYARFGDWFAWFAIALATGCILLLSATRTRRGA